MGKGDAIKFWEDKWLKNDSTLKQNFKRLFNISLQQSCFINQVGSWVEGQWKWSLSWRRSLFVWETSLLDELMKELDAVNILKEGQKDNWMWEASDDGKFSVKSCYEVLLGPNLIEDHGFFKLLWSVAAPSKVLAFSWRVALDRIQTKHNLKKRGVIHSDPLSSCTFCQTQVESMNHLLFSCSFSWQVYMDAYLQLAGSIFCTSGGCTGTF